MPLNSQFSKTTNQNAEDEAKAAEAQHAALTKMMQAPHFPAPTPPMAPLAAQLPAVRPAQAAPVPQALHPFHQLNAMLSPPVQSAQPVHPAAAAAPIPISPGVPKKPFQRRI